MNARSTGWRWLLIAMLFLSGLLLLPVLLIRAQPYHDDALRAVLIPPATCPAPCFMGIRPGSTSFEQALGLLRDHAWIEQLGPRQRLSPSIVLNAWRWTGADRYLPADGFDSFIYSEARTITNVTAQTGIPLIEIWWLYGPPYWMRRFEQANGSAHYTFGYPQYGMIASLWVEGCEPLLAVLTTPTRLTFVRSVFDSAERIPVDYLTDVSLAAFRNVNPCRTARGA
jgi:hypothetical protein